MSYQTQFERIFQQIQETRPLVHHLTNYVTVNDCANSVLALGGSPVMADDLEEVEEMVSIASALVLNVGTLNQRTIQAFIKAGRRANQLQVPVILDPVGVGATTLRTKTVETLLDQVQLAVLRGNMSEIKTIYGLNSLTRGVDSTDNTLEGGREIGTELARRLQATVVITGATDIVTDGTQGYTIENGHISLTKITGSGCMTTSLIGVCCGAKVSVLHGALLGTAAMGIAGELAFEALSTPTAYGSFRTKLIDAISGLTPEIVLERGKIHAFAN